MSHLTKSSLHTSKYPISTASVAVKASSSSTTASATVAIPKFCTACRATVPQDSPYKWCIRCRSKDKEKRKRKASRRTSVLPTPGTIPMDTVRIGNVTVNTLYMTLDDVAGFSNDFEPLPPKKKLKKEASTSLKGKPPLGHGPDVPIEDKIRAYVKARRTQEGSESTLGKRQVRQMNSVSMDVWTPAECLEFQTSTALYGALAAEVKRYYKNHTTTSSRITFRGCYSIVMDPNMPHSRRVDGEATLVRKIGKLPHGTHTISETTQLECYQRTFACKCIELLPRPAPLVPAINATSVTASVAIPSASSSGSSTPVVGTSSSKSALKRQQSDLSKWVLRQGTKATPPLATPRHVGVTGIPGTGLFKTSILPSPTPTPTPAPQPTPAIRSCGGNVTITVIDDFSHILGAMCKGQKIIITIEHPKSRGS